MRVRLRSQWAFILGGYILTCIFVIAVSVYNNNSVSAGLESVKRAHFPAYTFIVRLEGKIDLFSRTLNEAVLTGDEELLAQAINSVSELNRMFERSSEVVLSVHSNKLSEFRARFNIYVERITKLARQLVRADELALSDSKIQDVARRVAEDRRLVEYMLRELVTDFESILDDRVSSIQVEAEYNIEHTIVSALLILVIFTAVAFMNLKGVLSGLRQLAFATKELTLGNHKVVSDLDDRRSDEVGELAAAFKKMTRDLHETTLSKDYVASVLDSIAETLLVIDVSKNIEIANRSADLVLGYQENELQGRHIYEIIDIGRYADILNELAAGAVAVLDIPFRRKDGAQIEMSVSATYMKSGSEKQKDSLIMIAQDVSERRQQERELIEAKETAENLLHSKSEFLANMSHELRTPLNGVLGMSQLLLSTHMDKEQSGYVKTITSSGQHLLALINDVLDFSKIEAGRMSLSQEPFHFRQIVEDSVAMLAANQKNINVELMVYYDSDLSDHYVGDAVRIRQIVVNFVGNAMKFTDNGYIVVSVKRLVSSDPQAPNVRIEVADSGIGIAKDQLANIFEVFTQADGSTTRKHGGTGLGLAISKLMAELMGGDIGVDSKLGSGSRFFIDLPLLAHQPEHERIIKQPLHQTNLIVLHGSSRACSVYMQQLADWGAQVTAVRSTEDLDARLNFIDTEEPLVLVIDALVHKKQGKDLFNKFISAGCQVRKAIVLTEMGHEREIERFDDCIQVVSKPMFRDIMVKAITGHSSSSSAQRRAVAAPTENKSFKILLVEDNKVNQRVAAAMLKKLGHDVDLAENGEEALRNIQLQKYNAVFMDCQMPVLDGWEATRQIRKLGPEYEALPIIALTANALTGDREVCLEAGMSDYLSKPVKKQELADVIERFCVDVEA